MEIVHIHKLKLQVSRRVTMYRNEPQERYRYEIKISIDAVLTRIMLNNMKSCRTYSNMMDLQYLIRSLVVHRKYKIENHKNAV